jgi:hypothetical protein
MYDSKVLSPQTIKANYVQWRTHLLCAIREERKVWGRTLGDRGRKAYALRQRRKQLLEKEG